jgi:hypothetical protein
MLFRAVLNATRWNAQAPTLAEPVIVQRSGHRP